MPTTLLIIISGLPCTGKTTLGKKIASEFCLPFISKDDIKESLFDGLGYSNREWSKKIGYASYAILYYLAESLLRANTPLIIESNFTAKYDNKKFTDLRAKYNFTAIQIECRTDGAILFERFKQRSESGERHPGHADHLNYDEFKDILLKGEQEHLDIGGTVFDIDTTNFETIDYNALFEAIKNELYYIR